MGICAVVAVERIVNGVCGRWQTAGKGGVAIESKNG